MDGPGWSREALGFSAEGINLFQLKALRITDVASLPLRIVQQCYEHLNLLVAGPGGAIGWWD